MNPPVSEPLLKPDIERVFESVNHHFQEQMRIRQEMDYAMCEDGSLEEALQHAINNPGREREAWEWLSNAFEFLNLLLKDRGLPPMHYPGYQRFMRLLRAAR